MHFAKVPLQFIWPKQRLVVKLGWFLTNSTVIVFYSYCCVMFSFSLFSLTVFLTKSVALPCKVSEMCTRSVSFISIQSICVDEENSVQHIFIMPGLLLSKISRRSYEWYFSHRQKINNIHFPGHGVWHRHFYHWGFWDRIRGFSRCYEKNALLVYFPSNKTQIAWREIEKKVSYVDYRMGLYLNIGVQHKSVWV